MRRYIRHPSDVPVEFEEMLSTNGPRIEKLSNVSLGGVAFYCSRDIPVNTLIKLKIPTINPEFVAHCQVVWSTAVEGGGFEIGVEFLSRDEAFRARMVEQVCHIEHYKRQVMQLEGRELTGEQAAREWISKYAEEFPKIDQLEEFH